MKIKNLILILLGISLNSCNKFSTDIKQEDGFLIFGHFNGECIGNHCVDLFKITSNQLFEDTLDTYPQPGKFNTVYFKVLTTSQFNDTKDILQFFPQDLLIEPSVLGNPDAADQGGIYIELKTKDVRKVWLIDQNKNRVPSKYHKFLDIVNEKINLLR